MPQNPTDAQIAATQPVKIDTVTVGQGLDGNLFATGILKPEVSDFLAYRFPQYVTTAMLERLERYEPVAQSTWSWFEQDRTRKSAEITAGSGTGASLTLTTDVPATAAGDGYFLEKDILRTETGLNIRVTAIGEAGGVQTITVVRQDGNPFVGGDIADTERVGHSTNANEEGSFGPGTREYLPNERRAKLNIIRRGCEITGDALTAKSWFEDGRSWYYDQEMIDMDEFARDRENAIMFNTESPDGATAQTAVTETDIQNHIKDMLIQSPAQEFACICGADFLTSVQQALKDYVVGGGVSYGSFGDQMLGLDVHHYQFLGKKIHFIHYYPFDDLETLPFAGTATAAKTNYSNYSLWLNLGSQMGKKLVNLKYRELEGQQRKFIYKYIDGMMSMDTGATRAANSFDGLRSEMLSQIGVEVRLLNNHGVLAANA